MAQATAAANESKKTAVYKVIQGRVLVPGGEDGRLYVDNGDITELSDVDAKNMLAIGVVELVK